MFVPVCCECDCHSQSGTQQHHRAPGKQEPQVTKDKAQNFVKTWLKAGLKEVLSDIALCEKVFMVIFIKYHKAIPSSAAAECCSPQPKTFYRVERATLSDANNFQRLMFMKGNQHYIRAMEKEQETILESMFN